MPRMPVVQEFKKKKKMYFFLLIGKCAVLKMYRCT